MLAFYYIYIYLFVLGLFLIDECRLYNSPGWDYNYSRSRTISAFFLTVLVTLFIGLRPVHYVFSDMVGYYLGYMSMMGDTFVLNTQTVDNLIFDNLYTLFPSLNIDPTIFFLFIASVYFGCLYLACKKMFPNDVMLTLLVCLTAFSAFSYATNGIKAGAAASLFLLALAYVDEKKWLFAFLVFLSWGFHHSMIMVIGSLLLSIFYKNTKAYFLIWLICLVLAIFHVSFFQDFFSGLAREKELSYLRPEEGTYLTGFRPDFVLYSAVPVIIGFWLIFKQRIHDSRYELMLRLYLTTNSIWMLCMYAAFTNRIAYLSWFMYPIVLIYPFIAINWNCKCGHYARNTALFHYLFTVFMNVIYYNIIHV